MALKSDTVLSLIHLRFRGDVSQTGALRDCYLK